jgi:hypothetical protein
MSKTDHPLLAQIKGKVKVLEQTIKDLKDNKLSCEHGIAIARLSDSESKYRRQILHEAIFDAKHHPEKPKPYFADAAK